MEQSEPTSFESMPGGNLPGDDNEPSVVRRWAARFGRVPFRKKLHHRRRFWWITIPALVLASALFGLFFLKNPLIDKANPNSPHSHDFIVPQNATMAMIADSLKAQGYLRSEITFKAAAKLIRAGHGLHAGTFNLNRGLNNLQLLQDLIGDKYQVIYQLKILEGFRMKDIAEQASTNLEVDKNEFLKAATDPAFLRSLGLPPEAKSAEGFLYPDNYKWLYPLNGKTLVQALVTRFHQMVPDTLLAAASSRGLSPFQVVTMGSIVEGETKDSAEKYLVASAYENRFRIGMRLQADPTVQYGLALDRPITHSDIMKMTAYNTYLQTGLPPTPINNPNRQTIIATVYPAVTNYIFFVAKRDGTRTHYFAQTYAEHQLNIKKEERNIAGNVGGR